MGNVESVHEKSEDQENGVNTDNYEILSEQVCVQNGPATLQNAQPVSFQKSDLVDARTSNQQNNVSISTQKAMEISSISDESGTDLGTEAKPDAPPARSRFRMSLSRPVSGRTATQATNATDASLKLDISSQNPPVNNAPSEKIPLPEVVEVNESSNKTQVQVPNSVTLSEIEVSTAPPSEAEITQPKPKEISLFDKLFKPEKAKEKSKSPGEDSQEILTVAEQDPVIVVNASSGLQSNAPPAQDVADCNQNTVTLSSPASVSFAEDFQDPEESQGSTKPATPPVEHPVMSFFKTLVSPNKTPSKPEEEQKKEPEENSTKETHQSTAANLAQEPVAVSVTVKSEKASPAQITKQDTKSSESAGNQQQQQQVTKTPEIQKDDAKEKAAKESTPRTRLFWKKSIKEEPQVSEPTENNAAEPEMEAVKVEVSVQASAPSKDDTKSQEADDKARKSKGEESKPPKPKLMTFFKQLSVIGDGGNTNSVEINEKDPSQPTLDSTDGAAAKPPEKAVAPAAVEAQPAAQKIKDASKEKKAAVEQSKQKANKPETKDSQDALSSAPQQAPESSVLQNGGGSPRNSPKRLEKRQSFGAFFKGIGPKRTCDAESQTDPVSILPAEKAK
ncbi:breast carcinoma-amplified sequence 1 isoform X5 [Ambystoma mexicanum]|uniref:breast carcinoma-amplified sequence 1 isoform X5 n=1 Tax=Ambystoma mexicanum TaxID=8296 RepID=UPI0037E8D9AD